MSSINYNPLPGDLREKLTLLDILNKILKNNGFLDADQINSDIQALKDQINLLLQQVLGVEHDIDGIHNYDDTDLKTRLEDMLRSIDGLADDVDTLAGRLGGINSTTSSISIFNQNSVKASVLDNGFSQTTIKFLPGQISLQSSETGNNKLYKQVTLEGGSTDSRVTISSDNPISLTTRTLDHYVNVTRDKNEISDVNGFVFESTGAPNVPGITIRTFDNEHYVDIPWTTDFIAGNSTAINEEPPAMGDLSF
jgi:hypothetical protein